MVLRGKAGHVIFGSERGLQRLRRIYLRRFRTLPTVAAIGIHEEHARINKGPDVATRQRSIHQIARAFCANTIIVSPSCCRFHLGGFGDARCQMQNSIAACHGFS